MKTKDRIFVMYPSGARAPSVTEAEALRMCRAGVARALVTGKRREFDTIRLIEGPARPVAGTKHVTRSEGPDNPHNVWKLKPIPAQFASHFGLRPPCTAA